MVDSQLFPNDDYEQILDKLSKLTNSIHWILNDQDSMNNKILKILEQFRVKWGFKDNQVLEEVPLAQLLEVRILINNIYNLTYQNYLSITHKQEWSAYESAQAWRSRIQREI